MKRGVDKKDRGEEEEESRMGGRRGRKKWSEMRRGEKGDRAK